MSIGSPAALVWVSCAAMYREGLETPLFYLALVEFGDGLGWWIVAGLVAGVAASAAVAVVIFVLGRRLPVTVLLAVRWC